MRHIRTYFIIALFFISSAGFSFAQDIPNFGKVDEGLYRGGQPDEADFEYLKDLQIKTVVCLRTEKYIIDWEKGLCLRYGMNFVSIPMSSRIGVTKDNVREFLEVVSNPKDRPIFLHCRHGSHRTGVLVALYRILYYDWTPEEAYKEALSFGLGHSYPKLKKFILKDAQRLKKEFPN